MAHTAFPGDLPVPSDDGACDHLRNTKLPSVTLRTTSGKHLDVSQIPGLAVIFCYPRTGAPGETVPDSWNSIPGARGCTPQACSFRDSSVELSKLGVSSVFGVSTQDTEYQREAKERLHLQYELLSDEELELVKALHLPTFEWEGKEVIRRLSMVVEDGLVIKVFYPVFPPDRSAAEVVEWLKADYAGTSLSGAAPASRHTQ